MKISKQTLEILKNFSTINSNIVVRPGNVLSTISSSLSVFSRAQVKETFDREFAIYDLNSLLGLLSMMEDQEIDFNDDYMSISSGSSEFKYYYSDASIVTGAPDKEIPLDEYFTFKISSSIIETLKKAASVISAPVISVVSKNGKVTISVGDPQTPRSNSYTLEIGEFDSDFDCRIPVENFKVITADYDCVLSQKKFMYLCNDTMKYWIALDPINSKI